jgi:hypothetical protein
VLSISALPSAAPCLLPQLDLWGAQTRLQAGEAVFADESTEAVAALDDSRRWCAHDMKLSVQ